MADDKDDRYKIIVVGAGAVGKSSLTIRYVIGDFMDHYDPTIEDYYRKLVEVDGKPAMLDILDTAGQDEFASMQEQFYRQGKGCLIVYAIDKEHTFEKARLLKDKIAAARYDDHAFAVVLCGNKCDLDGEGKRKVAKASGAQLAKQWGCPFMETSAKLEKNNKECFEVLVREIRKCYNYKGDGRASISHPSKPSAGPLGWCLLL